METARSWREERSASRFWKEVYWFVIVSITGAAIGLWVLPARATRHRGLVELESRLREKAARLEEQKQVLETAVHDVEHDPFYREAVWRRVLGVKQNSEEFLEPHPAVVR